MNSSETKLTFCAGVGTVTGANFLLETSGEGEGAMGGVKILVDCGLIQGEKVAMEENREAFIYDVSKISALIITHAHLNHVGRIPKLVREGYQGPIYSTPQTRDLAELVLNDAVGILDMEARQNGLDPLYSREDVAKVFMNWKTVPYHESATIVDGVSITLKDAGHILGSAMVEVAIRSKENEVGSKELCILFTGDVGNSPAPLLRDTESVGDVDYIVMESVYGDRNHPPKEERQQQLEKAVNDTISRGGTLVIPAFSIDRAQVLLYELNNLVEQGRIPSVPVFVDSPMAIKATEIYRANKNLFNEKVQGQISNGDDIFSFPKLSFTVSQGESRRIEREHQAKIILAGSGMSIGGRVISHEEHYLPDEKNTILLVGYQVAGSLGRELADGAKKVRIHGRHVHVRAHVEMINGYSAHKDSDHLVEFVSTASAPRLKKVFVVMGEPSSAMHLAQRLNDELDAHAVVPERGKGYEL